MVAQSNSQRRDWTLALLGATAGLVSALMTMCVSYPFGHYAASRGGFVDFCQILVPGTVFAVMVSCCFAVLGYLHHVWRAIGIVLTLALSYCLSVWVATGVELNSPFLSNSNRGNVSGQALFVGGLVGAFFTLCAVSFLLSSGSSWQRRLAKVLCWTPLGGFLGVAGWALGPVLGMAFWQVVHAMNLTGPTETFRNAQGQTSHMYSLWAVWQTGMGFAFGLFVDGKRRANAQAAVFQAPGITGG